MLSAWDEDQARSVVRHYGDKGFSADVALRVYSSRLLGREPRLVQHGGGNTSLKTTDRDVAGEVIDVIRVKGSGWDLGDIEPVGLPAMRLGDLLRLRAIPAMSDEAMVNAQRGALLDSGSPTPSVETLLHAWIPQTVIDHTHANAVLALTDQPDGEALTREVYGEQMGVCPYVMPGFGLAHAAARAYEQNPGAKGLVLLKHGIFTWGEDAREAYERMIAMVTLAERRLGRTWAASKSVDHDNQSDETARGLALVLRGALGQALGRPVVIERRIDSSIFDYLDGGDLHRYANAGPVTPDHVLRIKPRPMILPPLTGRSAPEMGEAVRTALADYGAWHQSYFQRNNDRVGGDRRTLDDMPRVVLAPGLGLFAAGFSAAEARVAADVAETNIEVIAAAEAFNRFESLPEADVFDVEYWSLEQAKLGKAKAGRLGGQVVVISGGGGAIGAATAAAFAVEGAEVVLLDLDLTAATTAAKTCKGLAVACDVTNPAQIEAAIARVVDHYGGLDILVSNAGGAWSGRIGEVDEALLRRSFELNFFAHQALAKAAVKVMREQGMGGVLLFNISKQAVNPGADFGPYGLPKAALMALMRQYALDYGAEGIRACGVNADRIRSGLLTPDMVRARSLARGVSEQDYMAGNLLGREVEASDVGAAFVALALAHKTTGAVITVDGGNIAAALR